MPARKSLSLLSIPLLSSAVILAIFVLVTSLNIKESQKLVTNEVIGVSGDFDPTAKTGYFFDKEVSVPKEIKPSKTKVLGESSGDNKWIEVDLSEQKLKAWEGSNLYLESAVSTGLPWWPTPKGTFNIWYKIKYTRMKGGEGKYAYNLPNVPYTMFFENAEVPGKRGYGLHGTYWHNEFGTARSHGCVNLPTPVAEKLYYWTTPVLGSSNVVRSTPENPGTKIVIHE